MSTINIVLGAHEKPPTAIGRRIFLNGLLAISLLASVSPARAIPPPPPLAPLLRHATMTVTVRLIEAKNGEVSKISELCKVSGTIPVYSDTGHPASFNAGEIEGCSMLWKGEKLSVSIWGTKAISGSTGAFASAGVSVVPPGAAPGCAVFCGPQPLADSRADIRTSGNPKSIRFSLNPNPASVLKAKPGVWFDAEVEIVD